MHPIRLLFLLGVVACGAADTVSPPPPDDRVYIQLWFVESWRPDTVSNDTYELLGATPDDKGFMRAHPGDNITVKVKASPTWDALEVSFIIPDSVPRGWVDSLPWYMPVITLTRRAPAVIQGTWSADFSGPTIWLEIYAPRGLQVVSLTDATVYEFACRNQDFWCLDLVENRSWGPASQHDSLATGQRGWIELRGPWVNWPNALPPHGYGEFEAQSGIGWSTRLSVYLEDDEGFRGQVYCHGGQIPGADQDAGCY